jgi:hypothetical protein
VSLGFQGVVAGSAFDHAKTSDSRPISDQRLRSDRAEGGPGGADSGPGGRLLPGPGPGCGLGAGSRSLRAQVGQNGNGSGAAMHWLGQKHSFPYDLILKIFQKNYLINFI